MNETERITLPLAALIPNPKNDRIHPARQIALMVKSIERFGQPRPVLARAANRMLIAGHAVHQAMGEAGKQEIDVLLWDVDQKTADAFLEADNRFGELSTSDPDRRRALLADVDENDWPALGFAPNEVKRLLEEQQIEVREIETGPVADEFWITCRGPLPRQAEVLQKMRALLAEFRDVEIDLGTIPVDLV